MPLVINCNGLRQFSPCVPGRQQHRRVDLSPQLASAHDFCASSGIPVRREGRYKLCIQFAPHISLIVGSKVLRQLPLCAWKIATPEGGPISPDSHCTQLLCEQQCLCPEGEKAFAVYIVCPARLSHSRFSLSQRHNLVRFFCDPLENAYLNRPCNELTTSNKES